MRLWVLVTSASLAVLTGSATVTRAGPLLVPTAQERRIEVSAVVFDKKDSSSRSADSFGAFDQSLTVHPIQIVDGVRYAAQGNASQKSALGSDAFTFSGSIYAQSIHPANSNAIGRSLFDVKFDVMSPAHYALDGFMHNPGGTPAAGKLEFTLLAGDQALFKSNAGADPIKSSGALGAGSYRMLLDAGGLGNSSAAGGGVDFNVTLAAVADVEAPPVIGVPLPSAIRSGTILLGLLAIATKLPKSLRPAKLTSRRVR